MSKQFEDIVIYEIRENRKSISKCSSEIGKLKLQVFSNKIKLGMFIAGVTIFFNIVFIILAEKIRTFLA